MAIGGLIAGTTVALMLASTPVSTIQVAAASADSPSAAVTSTAQLTSRLPWTLDFDYGLLAVPSAVDEQTLQTSFEATNAQTSQGSAAVAAGAEPTPRLAALVPEVLDTGVHVVPATLTGAYSISRTMWSPSTSALPRQTRSVPSAAISGAGVLLATSESKALGALLAPQAEWDAIRAGAGVAYTDASFSMAARSPKEPALVSRVESTAASEASDPDTTVPTPGTLALLALGISAVIAGARSRDHAPSRLLRG